jgi:hypothetical protein
MEKLRTASWALCANASPWSWAPTLIQGLKKTKGMDHAASQVQLLRATRSQGTIPIIQKRIPLSIRQAFS